MSLLKPALLFFAMTLSVLNGTSQDKLYFASNTTRGTVKDISSTKLTYTPQEAAKPVNVETKKIFLIFNSQGAYLLPSHMDFSSDASRHLVDKFLSRQSGRASSDKIYGPQNVIDGMFVSEDKNFIYYTQAGKPSRLEKEKVVAIIFKDGRHIIYKNPSETAAILWAVEKSLAVTQNNAVKDPAVAPVETVSTKESNASINGIGTSAVGIIPVTDSVKPLVFEDLVSNITKEEFEKKASEKTNQFGRYVGILCDKSKEAFEHNKAIDQALTLFVNERARVEVSSLNRNETASKLIKQYLLSLKMLSYDRIELEWASVNYVTDVKKGPDGNWYGSVTFEQKFKGYIDNKVVYEDITRKSASVVMKTYEKSVNGSNQTGWEVLLSDIGVKSTQGVKAGE